MAREAYHVLVRLSLILRDFRFYGVLWRESMERELGGVDERYAFSGLDCVAFIGVDLQNAARRKAGQCYLGGFKYA